MGAVQGVLYVKQRVSRMRKQEGGSHKLTRDVLGLTNTSFHTEEAPQVSSNGKRAHTKTQHGEISEPWE